MSLKIVIFKVLPGAGFLWKGPPLKKEGHFYSFGKVTLKFSSTKPPLTLLTKGLPLNLGGSKCSYKVIKHSFRTLSYI